MLTFSFYILAFLTFSIFSYGGVALCGASIVSGKIHQTKSSAETLKQRETDHKRHKADFMEPWVTTGGGRWGGGHKQS